MPRCGRRWALESQAKHLLGPSPGSTLFDYQRNEPYRCRMSRVIRSAIVRFGAVCRRTSTERGRRSRGQGTLTPPAPAATPRMHSRQNECPQTVVTGSVSRPRQMGQDSASSIATASKPDELPPPSILPLAAAGGTASAAGASTGAGARGTLLLAPPPRAGSTRARPPTSRRGAGAGAAATTLLPAPPCGAGASCIRISERRLAKSSSLSPGSASNTSDSSRCAERWRGSGK